MKHCVTVANGTIFSQSENPRVEDSLLVGNSVFGESRRSENAPACGTKHFESLLGLAVGIKDKAEGSVTIYLGEIADGLDDYENPFKGTILEGEELF